MLNRALRIQCRMRCMGQPEMYVEPHSGPLPWWESQEAWHTPRDPDVNCGQSVNDAFPWLNEFPGREVGTTLIGYQWRTRPRRRRFFERSWNGAYYWPN